MQATARAKYLRTTTRKMGQTMDLVRGKKVEEALNILRFTPKKAAMMLEKVLHSAVANAQNIHGDKIHDPGDMRIVSLKCDEGPTMKRIDARAMGRAYRIRKRTCHVEIILDTEQ